MKAAPLSLRVIRALQLAPMTIADLARCLCASGPAVRRKVDELVAAGMARRAGLRENRVSRPAALFEYIA